jgi:MoxR-like ATPase
MTTSHAAIDGLRVALNQQIIEQDQAITLILAALLSQGHVLAEDLPGKGKTVLMRLLARLAGCDFQRIQCTPDLLPSDATGVSVYNQQTNSFQFHPGPLVSQFVLADEINRATPRSQSALLEAMAEGQVTVDRQTHPLPRPFFLMATQNPIEFEGTFPLPEAQLDRFAVVVHFATLSEDGALRLLAQGEVHPEQCSPLVNAHDLIAAQDEVRRVRVETPAARYIVALCRQTWQHPKVALGLSDRASLILLRVSQSWAWLRGGTFLELDDIKAVFGAVAGHRLSLTLGYDALERQRALASILGEILHATEATGSFQTVAAPQGRRR